MASFNLGRIKGDKGDKGDTGAMGERGPQGEKGEKGNNGADGKTPVFSIGETVTLSAGEEAYVELDSSDVESPVLSFHIPRGNDGRDANGDMEKSIYDSEGVGEDFYHYAQALFENALKKEGDTLIGSLKASGEKCEEAVMRNISVQKALPDVAMEGDVCIVVPDENNKKLGDCVEGSIVLIPENKTNREYILIAKNNYASNSVLLMRKELSEEEIFFNYENRNSYEMSNADMILEIGHKNKFSDAVLRNIICVNLGKDVMRHCFLLSKNDFESIEYLQNEENRITGEFYLTRTVTSDRVFVINKGGTFGDSAQRSKNKYRPAIVLPQDLEVENTIYKSTDPAVKILDKKYGLYVFVKGNWKECASL